MAEAPDAKLDDLPIPPLLRAYFGGHMRIMATLRADIEAKGLARDEFDVLVALGKADGVTCKALAAAVLVPNPTLTRTLARLEARGLITSAKGPADKRQRLVSLSPAGRAAYEGAHGPHVALVRRAVGRLTPEEQATLVGLLRKLAEGFVAEGRGG